MAHSVYSIDFNYTPPEQSSPEQATPVGGEAKNATTETWLELGRTRSWGKKRLLVSPIRTRTGFLHYACSSYRYTMAYPCWLESVEYCMPCVCAVHRFWLEQVNRLALDA